MLKQLYQVVLNDGLMKRKYINSKIIKLSEHEAFKGSVFVFTSKEKMSNAQGIVMTSFEAIDDIKAKITHWTPNIYQYGEYTDSRKLYVKGHQESNLKKINTFYLDIDSEKITHEDILLICLDELGLMPTMILKTTRGYQVYFVLESPAYVTDKSDYRVIEVAKMISQNLRYFFLNHNIPVDLMCNHFGIARFPTDNNVVYFNHQAKYDFNRWLTWSKKQENQSYQKPKQQFGVYQYVKQTEEKWFSLLLNQSHFKGKKGLMGRNNTIFTLALAHYSSNESKETCEDVLTDFNNRLKEPVSPKEFNKIIDSAYSGEYLGAGKEYIYNLCREWVDDTLTNKDLFTYQKWHKYARPRHERTNVHFHEWAVDVMDYLQSLDNTYVETTKQQICDAIGISPRSLGHVLKRMAETNVILYSAKSGRTGGIKLALTQRVYARIITLSKEKKEAYIERLIDFMAIPSTEMVAKLEGLTAETRQVNLFDIDIGNSVL